MKTDNNIGSRDFSKKVIKALATKGIVIYGITAIPDFEGDVYFSGTGYKLNDNGTSKIRRYSEVVLMSI